MFSVTAILLVFAVLQGDPLRSARGINSGLEGWQQAHCEQLRRLSSNVQFPWYCKPGRISVISVGFKHAGQDLWYNVRNQLSYTGLVSRMSDVQFITEQDGTGDIQAKFNGYILSCQGLPANKRKLCTIPRSRGPWGGTITVQIIGSHVSTFFRMAGKPVCPNPGLQGYNCDQDINECVVHKDKQLCAWKDGCVNTYGGYKCKCPPGYKVSSQDFRLCEKDIPKITSPPKTLTVMFFQTVTLPCRYTASGPVIVKWIINGKLIAFKNLNGAKQTSSPRLTLYDNGDLSIKNITYGDAGKFFCVVQNVKFGTYVSHTLVVESKPLMDAQFFVNGNHTTSHVYRVGDNVVINCHVIALPVPTVTWSHGNQIITNTAKTKVILSKHPNFAAFLQLQLRILVVTTADAGVYSCRAVNSHGVTTKSIKLTVLQ